MSRSFVRAIARSADELATRRSVDELASHRSGRSRSLVALVLAVLACACSSAGFDRAVAMPAAERHRSPAGAIYEDVAVGDGAIAAFGSFVRVDCVGSLDDGTVFDSTYDRGTPLEFTLGKGEVVRGFEDALLGMRVGGKRRITIPPELGYGDSGLADLVPPNATLTLEVELLEVTGP